MKKIAAWILVLLLTFGCVLAEGIDFGSLSDSELLEIRNNAIQEICTRQKKGEWQFQDVFLTAGVYVVGVDIVPGTYAFRCEEISEDASIGLAFVEIFRDAKQAAKGYNNYDIESFGTEGRTEIMNQLDDGMIVSVKYGSFTLKYLG